MGKHTSHSISCQSPSIHQGHPCLPLLVFLSICFKRRRRQRAQNAAYSNNEAYAQNNQYQGNMQQTGAGYYAQPAPGGYAQPQGSYYGQQQQNQNPYANGSSEYREWEQSNGQQYAAPNSPPPVPEYTPAAVGNTNTGDGSFAPPPGPPPQAAGQEGQASKYYQSTNRAGDSAV